MRIQVRSVKLLICAIVVFACFTTSAFAVDGVVLINRNVALAGLGGCDSPGFPVTICQAGSYKLSGNLTVPDKDTTAIQITSSSVSLDLNGFAITGPGTCGRHACLGGAGDGVNVNGSLTNVKIANGVITGVGHDAVFGDAGSAVAVERLQISSANFGVRLFGGGTVSNVKVDNMLNWGINCSSCTVESSRATNCFYGFAIDQYSTMLRNLATGNDAGAFLGSNVGYGENVFTNNSLDIVSSGAVSMGNNVCGSATC